METKNPLNDRVDPVWTIWVPLGVTIFLAILTAAAILVSYFSGGEISRWASGFTTLVILTIIISSLVVFVVLAFSIAGLKEFSHILPEWMRKLQIYSILGNVNGKRVMNGMVRPFILIKQGVAGIQKTVARKP